MFTWDLLTVMKQSIPLKDLFVKLTEKDLLAFVPLLQPVTNIFINTWNCTVK